MLSDSGPALSVVHGDCVGADAEFDAIAAELGLWRVARPGCDQGGRSPKRAWCDVDVVRPTEPYAVRNGRIVADAGVLIACPSGPEKRRSGTWSTVRKARAAGVPVVVVMP